MSSNLPPLPPAGDDWPPRRPEDMARYSSLQLLIRARRVVDLELSALLAELERRARDGEGSVQ